MKAPRPRGPLLAAAFVALYALSIPWYRAPGAVPAIWLGLPDWVIVAMAAHVAVAGLCAWTWLSRDRGEGP